MVDGRLTTVVVFCASVWDMDGLRLLWCQGIKLRKGRSPKATAWCADGFVQSCPFRHLLSEAANHISDQDRCICGDAGAGPIGARGMFDLVGEC